jgi:hypothetical protein
MSRSATIFVFALALAAPSSAQSVYTAEMLRNLPSGNNLFALLEAAQPEITTDRFNSGGLNAGVPERMSAFLASWSQTQYRIGDVFISSPADGTPMVFPELTWWSEIDVDPARLSAGSAATGLAVDLAPRAASGRWSWSIDGSGSGGSLSQASTSSIAPAIAQLDDAMHLSAIVSGHAMGDRLGLVIGAARTRSDTFERAGRHTHDTQSLFVNASYALSPSQTLRALALVQRGARHLQATYGRKHWRIFGGYTSRSTHRVALPAFHEADRLYDGPIPSLIDSLAGQQRWVAGARSSHTANSRHAISAGLDVEGSSSTSAPVPVTTIAERVDGAQARLWTFSSPGVDSRRHAVQINAFVDDRFAVTSTVTLHGALRFEAADAAADGAANGISWRTLAPAAHLEWNLGTPLKLDFLTGVSRHADQPVLGLLAYGDPNAPTATVSRWADSPRPQVVMRVGPGTGGSPAFSSIDPDLKRPVTDQFILQLQSRPWASLRLRVTGLARRQSSLIHVVNTGVPFSTYTMFTIPDANADWVNPVDDQHLPVFNRDPNTFGRDRYLLTNPELEAATMGALVVSGEVVKPRWLFRIGGTASASVGSGGNRGYTSAENDQAVPGELFTNPNASTYARGRLFNDRAYTIKTMTVLRLPALVTVGAIARFQDGQPFSRLAIVDGLNQGAEAIHTFPNGRSRFSYRATLDLRVQKRFDKSMLRFEVLADAYNLLNAASEVEEYVVTGPRFREITAVQPPRSFHLGARVRF